MPLNLQYALSLSRCASRLTPSETCSWVLTRTYPMAVLLLFVVRCVFMVRVITLVHGRLI
jgi:hypothetical protein